MSIEVNPVDDPEQWNDLLDSADCATPFHRWEALEVFAEHTGTSSRPLVGYKGQEPVGLFPVFELQRGPMAAAFSPPPGRKIPYLGPIVFRKNGAKQRTYEKSHRRFVESAVSYIDDHLNPQYVNIRSPAMYHDPRPFVWHDFEATPRYTYHVDLTRSPDDILAAASSDLRSNIRKTEKDAYQIEQVGADGIAQIIEHAQARHEEQGVSYRVTPEFVQDLAEALPEQVAAYVCKADGAFAGGTVAVIGDDAVYRWQSVVDFDAPVPAHDLLDWHLIERGAEASCDRFDLVGANDPRLCEYKSKFAPDVATYYELTRSGPLMSLAASAYRRFR